MVTTRKRKSTSTAANTKKAKVKGEDLPSPSELPAAAEEKEKQQQLKDQDDVVTEEDSPTKKLNAANVLIAFSDGGTADAKVIDESQTKGTWCVSVLKRCFILILI